MFTFVGASCGHLCGSTAFLSELDPRKRNRNAEQRFSAVDSLTIGQLLGALQTFGTSFRNMNGRSDNTRTVTAIGTHVLRAVDGALELQQLGRVETVISDSRTNPPAADGGGETVM